MTGALTSSGLFGSQFRDADVAAAFSGPTFLARMISFERAWTVALGETGAVPAEVAAAALAAIDDAAPDLEDMAAGSDRDGLPVPALVRALKAHAGDAADAVHAGTTSQDVIDTTMVLTLQQVTRTLVGRLETALGTLETLRDRFGGAEIMGRTRMQAALPVPVAARLDAWTRPLREARERVDLVADSLPVQVGGAVGLRDKPAGRGADMPAIVARELGLAVSDVWHTDRTPFLDYGHALVLIAGALGKIGQDIALMAQQGIGEIAISGGGGSSAMPHKQNPVGAEALVTLARYVAGQQGLLAQSLVHEQERSGAAWSLEWLVLPAMAEATGAATRQAVDILSNVERIGPA